MLCPSCGNAIWVLVENKIIIKCTGSTTICSFYVVEYNEFDSVSYFMFKDNNTGVSNRISFIFDASDGTVCVYLEGRRLEEFNFDVTKYSRCEQSIYDLYNDCKIMMDKYKDNLFLM